MCCSLRCVGAKRVFFGCQQARSSYLGTKSTQNSGPKPLKRAQTDILFAVQVDTAPERPYTARELEAEGGQVEGDQPPKHTATSS